jgi:hypothetical protein
MWLKIKAGEVMGSFEYGNESFCSIKDVFGHAVWSGYILHTKEVGI